VKLTYGTPLERRLLSAAFVAASVFSAGFLWWQRVFTLPYLGLSLYFFLCGLLILRLPLPSGSPTAASRNLYRFLPALLLMGAIFLGSTFSVSSGVSFSVRDIYIHFAEFFALGLLTARMVNPFNRRDAVLPSTLLAVGVVAVFGALDEIHQAFVPGRNPDFGDLGWDVTGGLAGSLAYLLLALRRDGA